MDNITLFFYFISLGKVARNSFARERKILRSDFENRRWQRDLRYFGLRKI